MLTWKTEHSISSPNGEWHNTRTRHYGYIVTRVGVDPQWTAHHSRFGKFRTLGKFDTAEEGMAACQRHADAVASGATTPEPRPLTANAAVRELRVLAERHGSGCLCEMCSVLRRTA